jgi:pimeloyl-ACP methyl ester carboxylesterase
VQIEDVENATEDEMRLVQEIWQAAAEGDANVPSQQEYRDTLVRVPVIVQRALNALARSPYCAGYTPLQLFGDLKQVVRYLNDSEIRQRVLDRVLDKIAPDTRVVIGHSLGSVVAYEALCRKSGNAVGFITLGSPLGIRNVVFDKLQPRPGAMGVGLWPGSIQFWVNIADSGDIVAAQKRLAPLFEVGVEDMPVYNGWDAHNSQRYLGSIQAGQAVARALSVNP